jgi:hypothetical protein
MSQEMLARFGQVNGHGLQTSNAWAWRHGPQIQGMRYVRLRAASPTYGAVAITIAKEPGSEDAYYAHLALRLMGCLVLFYSSRVVCKGRLTMEEIIFSLKHYWRFADSDPLELKALSQGVDDKAACTQAEHIDRKSRDR